MSLKNHIHTWAYILKEYNLAILEVGPKKRTSFAGRREAVVLMC